MGVCVSMDATGEDIGFKATLGFLGRSYKFWLRGFWLKDSKDSTPCRFRTSELIVSGALRNLFEKGSNTLSGQRPSTTGMGMLFKDSRSKLPGPVPQIRRCSPIHYGSWGDSFFWVRVLLLGNLADNEPNGGSQ